eukprot:6122873-Pyramimonas_sp.AAC.1
MVTENREFVRLALVLGLVAAHGFNVFDDPNDGFALHRAAFGDHCDHQNKELVFGNDPSNGV